LTPTEPPPNQQALEDDPSPTRRISHTKWVLTSEALDQLLNHFSAEPEEAARLYEAMRVKLTRYFEWHSSISAEKEVDETFDRVARRISEGEEIFNLSAYFSSVARLVFMESLRERQRIEPLETAPEVVAEPPVDDDQKEARSQCLDECLSKLPVESQKLILAYYHEEGRAKIDRRKQLADALDIPLNALRIRAHRIRVNLEECVLNCLKSLSDPRNGMTSPS
jgi:DNA-directed RNA polymerase specialized sigma24 family protein